MLVLQVFTSFVVNIILTLTVICNLRLDLLAIAGLKTQDRNPKQIIHGYRYRFTDVHDTLAYIRIFLHIHTLPIRIQIHTYIFSCRHTHVQTHTCIGIHTSRPTHVHVQTHTCIGPTYTKAYIDVRTHMHRPIHTRTFCLGLQRSL